MGNGWAGSDRRERLPDNWVALVAEAKKRARNQCQARLPRTGKRCPRPGTDVDHIKPGDDHSPGNLQLLCSHHHLKKTGAESNQTRWGKKKIRPRTEGKHPGAIG